MTGNSKNELRRKKWENDYDFLFVAVGAAVGIGNVWRFPYLCYKNGGGVFLIPYFVSLVVIGLPHLILQTSLGQLTNRAPAKAWALVPIMQGLGYNCLVYSALSTIPYVTVIAWSLRYAYASFSGVLPWKTCGNAWNSDRCFPFDVNVSSLEYSIAFNNTNVNQTYTSSVVEYWENNVLAITSGIEVVGDVNKPMLLCVFITWAVSYLCTFKSINWTSKVTYVTATLPMIMLIVILVRGLTLDGASDGVAYFLSPDMTKLKEPQVWKDAALQIMYSLSLAFGYVVVLGSYNKRKHNFYRDCIVLASVNSFTSIIAGFSVFSVIGFMAKQQNTTVDVVAESGPGLAYIAYPQALAMMPAPNFWCVLFFLMLFLLGLDTLFVTIEAWVSAVSDLWPETFYKKNRKQLLSLFVSICLFLAGIPTVTGNGIYVLQILDNFTSTGWGVMCIVVLECIAISWIYGVDKYCSHISSMLGYTPRFHWYKYSWKYFTPIIGMTLFIYCLILYEPPIYNRTYVFPPAAIAIGWCLSVVNCISIPTYVMYYLIKKKYGIRKRENNNLEIIEVDLTLINSEITLAQ